MQPAAADLQHLAGLQQAQAGRISLAHHAHLSGAEEVRDHAGVRRDLEHAVEIADMVGIGVAEPDPAQFGRADLDPQPLQKLV